MKPDFPIGAMTQARAFCRASLAWIALLIAGCQAGGELGDPPFAPEIAVTPGDRSVRLEWQPVEGAGAYYLYVSEPQQGSTPPAQSRRMVTSPAAVEGLSNGTTYYLWVTSVGSGGESNVQQVHSVTPQPPPAAPQNILIATGNGSVALQWDAPAGAETYRVYRLRGSQPVEGDIASAPGLEGSNNAALPNFTVDGLDNGVEYSFVVTAINQSGESAPSAIVTATPGPFRSVSIGGNHGCVIDAKAQMWCWGSNSSGQVDGASGGRMLEPVQVGGIATWKTVSAGGSNTCGVTADESIMCWGSNSVGLTVVAERPNGSRSPLPEERWVALATGNDANCAVRGDGSLWCWGNLNGVNSGQLTRLGFASDWADVDVGGSHFCARKLDSSVWCWGNNDSGQLGTGTMESVERPVSIPLAGKVKALSTGMIHTCAIDMDDQLWCWGGNGSGQIGVDLTDGAIAQPSRVGGGSQWRDVKAANDWTCGVKTDGTLWCWGNNSFGQWGGAPRLTAEDLELIRTVPVSDVALGPPPLHAHTVPQPLPASPVDHAQVLGACASCHNGTMAPGKPSRHIATTDACEACHTTVAWVPARTGTSVTARSLVADTQALATSDAGDVITTDTTLSPRQVGADGDWVAVYAGEQHTCASKRDGSLWCLGRRQSGQLGVGGEPSAAEPPLVLDEAQALASRATMSCALRLDGTLWCWGDFSRGASTGTQFQVPTLVGAAGRFTKIFGVSEGICALTADDEMWCLGGSLGREPSYASLSMRGARISVAAMASSGNLFGPSGVCGIDAGRRLGCAAGFSQGTRLTIDIWSDLMGNGTVVQDPNLAAAVEPGQWRDVAMGYDHVCAISDDARLLCRGSNSAGQLGFFRGDAHDPNVFFHSADFIEPIPAVQMQDVAAGDYHTCAIGVDAALRCWGSMRQSLPAEPIDLVAPGSAWRTVESGPTSNCAIQVDGSLWCWGSGSYDSSYMVTPAWAGGSAEPKRIGILTDWIAVQPGDGFSCGLRSGGQVHCWGVNNLGQLGDGKAWLTEFTRVKFPDEQE